MTPSAVTPSAAAASSRPFIPVTDDPGAASIIAETMTKTKEVILLLPFSKLMCLPCFYPLVLLFFWCAFKVIL